MVEPRDGSSGQLCRAPTVNRPAGVDDLLDDEDGAEDAVWAVDFIALSIPVFFALMGLEWVVARFKGVDVYRFSDWVANLGCGIVQQTSKVALGLVTGVGYVYLYANHRILTLGADQWWVWVLCFLGVDFCYYWFHRLSHELNFMWAAHVVHHQSEEYNLGVALRQSAFQGLFSWAFYLPLAVVGFSPWVTGVVRALNTLYQFWIHTQLIGRLGPLEWVLNTPSHHRVHHGQNPQYIDRNHAGALIIWDKMFGTFEPEKEKVLFGVTEPPNSWNPVFANFHHLKLTWSRMVRARRLTDKVKVWWAMPGYLPEGVLPEGKRTNPSDKYDTPVGGALVGYVAAQFAVLAAATTAYLFYRRVVEPEAVGAWGLAIIATAGTLGALLDGRRWALSVEASRPAIVAAVFALIFPEQLLRPLPILVLGLSSVLSAVWLGFAVRVGGGDIFSGRSERAYQSRRGPSEG